MKQIIFTLPDDVSLDTARYILMDALAEFQTARGPNAEAYVNKRYPDTPEYAWLDRADKITQVERRRQIAEILRCTFEEVEA
jgi:hypothetical protein